MALSRRTEIRVLAGLIVLLGLSLWYARTRTPALAGVSAANFKYEPLKVEDPALRMDLLERIQKLEYTGTHRNIFSAEPPPPPAPPASKTNPAVAAPQGPAGLPPLEIPVTFFGYAVNPQTGKRQAFFTNGDDVFVVPEGGMLLNRFRLIKVGNNTADIVEESSGRRATLTMELPPQS
jgi:hypothetical protein